MSNSTLHRASTAQFPFQNFVLRAGFSSSLLKTRNIVAKYLKLNKNFFIISPYLM